MAAHAWLRIGLAWWAWVVLCSAAAAGVRPWAEGGIAVAGPGDGTLRFLLFVAALEYAVLRAPAARRWLLGLIAASAAYIAVQSLFQFAVAG